MEKNRIVIKRCVWHRKYHGKAIIQEITFTGNPDGMIDPENTEILVTDGACEDCSKRVLSEIGKHRTDHLLP